MGEASVKVGQTNYHFVRGVVRKDGETPVDLSGASVACEYMRVYGPWNSVPGDVIRTDPESGAPLASNQVAWRHPPDAESIFDSAGTYLFRLVIDGPDGQVSTETFSVIVSRY